MNNVLHVTLCAAIWCFVFGLAGSYIASQKRRSPAEGAIIGILFGPIGLIIEACLPEQNARPTASTSLPQLDTAPINCIRCGTTWNRTALVAGI